MTKYVSGSVMFLVVIFWRKGQSGQLVIHAPIMLMRYEKLGTILKICWRGFFFFVLLFICLFALIKLKTRWRYFGGATDLENGN